LTNKNAWFHWTLLLGALYKVTLTFWTEPPPDITPGTNTYNQWRPKIPKTGPWLQPSIGTNAKETKKNQWIFQGCKISRTSASLIRIFSKIPRTDLFFYFDISKIWNWWFFVTKLNPPTLELKSSNQWRVSIYCWAYQLVLGCLFSKFLPAWYWYLNFSKKIIAACYWYWIS